MGRSLHPDGCPKKFIIAAQRSYAKVSLRPNQEQSLLQFMGRFIITIALLSSAFMVAACGTEVDTLRKVLLVKRTQYASLTIGIVEQRIEIPKRPFSTRPFLGYLWRGFPFGRDYKESTGQIKGQVATSSF